MTAAFVLREDVDLSLELRVRLDRASLAEHLTALDVGLFNATEEETDVVASHTAVEGLLEHFDASDGRHLDVWTETNDFDGVADLDHAALNTTGRDGTTALNREHVFDRHEERLVRLTLRLWDEGVDRVHEVGDALVGGRVARVLERWECSAADDRGVVAWVAVLREEVADFHFDEVEEFRVSDVALVEEDDDLRNADLTAEEDVFAGLRHDAVDAGDDEDRAVHLGGTSDHVLDVVGVAGAVDVRVVTVGRLVLDVRGCDGHDLGGVAATFRLRRLGDLVVGNWLAEATRGLNRGDRSGEGGLAVVDVADGADVDVGLRTIEVLFGHVSSSSFRPPLATRSGRK